MRRLRCISKLSRATARPTTERFQAGAHFARLASFGWAPEGPGTFLGSAPAWLPPIAVRLVFPESRLRRRIPDFFPTAIVVAARTDRASRPSQSARRRRRCPAIVEFRLSRSSRISVQKQKGRSEDTDRPFEIIPAATYVPTQLPAQYHRPGEA